MSKRIRSSRASVQKSPANKSTARSTTQKSTASKSASSKSASSKSAAGRAPTKKTATKKTATKKPAAKKPAVKTSAVTKTATKKPAVNKTATKKSAAKKPAVKTSAVKKSAAKKPAVKTSAVNKPTPGKAAAGRAANKPAPSSVAKRQPVARPAAPPAEPTTYSLAELVARYGPATADEVFARVDREPPALVAAGVQVTTSRIDTDCARLYGRAGDFYNSASPAQRQALRGFSPALLRIALWSARHGQELFEKRRRGSSDGAARQEQRQLQAQALRAQATARRNQLAALLRLAAGGNGQHSAEVARAYGRIASPEELAQALDELVQLGRSYLDGSDPALARRAAAAGLDAAYLDQTAELAAKAREQLRSAEAPREAGDGSQPELDLWDGVNLYFLESIIELFDVANQIDPTVPRLIPISLRSYFGRGAPPKKPKAPAPESPQPSPEAAGHP